ncbi:MAG TPA: TldD/PmbA family protein [Kofleriaceae bacterium]|nr:TldD/PmbA family protein [Kofleriaceae bacterium]
MLSEAQARQLLERAATLIRSSKGAEGIVSLTNEQVGNTRFAVSEITSSSDVERTQLSITVQFGLRSATAVTNQLDDRALDDTIAHAKRMAQLSPENPELLPPLGAQAYRPAKNARDPGTARLGPEARAKAAGAALAALPAGAGVSMAGFFEHETKMHAIATTQGAWAHHTWTAAGLTCTARTADGTGSGWAGTSSNRAADLDAGALAKLAVDKAVRSAKPARLAPDRYTVVLEPAAVASLLGFLSGSLGARRADEGRSFFSKAGGGTKVGDKLFSEAITLRSDPTDAQLAARPFDGEAVPLQPTSWIERGALRALTYGRFWAKRQGRPATGQPAGWTLDGGTTPREELVKGVARGVLITRLWYLRMLDPQTILVTGLTRDGVFLIENGAVTRPVNNFRFNESPIQMLRRCDALSPAVLTEGNVRVPALRTHDFNLASISEAI